MKAALYVRVSSPDQAERWSLPAQRRLLTEFTERQGWEHEIYEDAGLSGETIDARPAMQRLLKDAIDRKFGIVLAVEMERFSRSRDAVDLAFIKRVFREAGIKFGTPAQIFDPEDVEDDFVSGMLGLLASREKQKIVQRTTRGRWEAVRAGRHVSPAPYGYRKAGTGALVVHETEAEVVRLIFGLLLEGYSSRGIIRELQARGIHSPRGARTWTRPTLFGILKNPVYGGTAYYGRQRVVEHRGKHRKLRPRDERQWVQVRVPRIVSEESVLQVRALLHRNALLSRRNQKRFYLLRGLVRCATCKRAMVGKFSGNYRYYSCWRAPHMDPAPHCRWHAVNADQLEAVVWEQVTLALRQPDLVLDAARQYRVSRLGERDELLIRLEYIRKALQELPVERERFQTQHAEGYATLDELKGHLAKIEQRRDKLDDERRALEGRLAVGTTDEEQEARLERIVAHVAHRLETLADQERFELVHAFIERIVVEGRRAVEIHAYVPAGERAAVSAKSSYVRTAWTHTFSR